MSLRGVIREEVAGALREQSSKMTDSLASYLRSGAGTPVPTAHTPDLNMLQALQDQVKLLVNKGKISDAFQTVSHTVAPLPVLVCCWAGVNIAVQVCSYDEELLYNRQLE